MAAAEGDTSNPGAVSAESPKEKKDPEEEKPPSTIRKIFDFVAGQWLTIGFGLACLFAHFFPCKYIFVSSLVS